MDLMDLTAAADALIVQQVIDGDTEAFAILLTRHRHHVLGIVRKHAPYDEAEEIAQEVFIRAYQSLPGLEKQDRFKHWISAIAVKTCCDFWRKKYRSREISISDFSTEQCNRLDQILSSRSNQDWIEDNARREVREMLDQALNHLSPEDRMALELVYLEGLSCREAADLLGWTIVNVKVRAFRSRKKLHSLLSKPGRRS
jgi:RNA polymerase sigma-70 factor (ECF subfamily)